ncbi:MAG: hypothetical protein ASARMPREDX12_006604 [Alectoria sarmentosa]|nr:MAG: hypothetical protein ASARMPREDX12_006604 [Alectoria sarmentosa]
MAPGVVDSTKVDGGWSTTSRLTGPLKYSGSLEEYKYFDATPILGREFPTLQLSDILNDDRKVRDLAILVSQRNVVFFRNQNLTVEEQKILLHRHVLANSKRGITVNEDGKLDDEVSVISSEQNRKHYDDRYGYHNRRLASKGWHSDITFEHIPSDYAVLKLVTVPDDGSGGDTLWASGYEAYDRLSPPWQKFAESLEATHHQPQFARIQKEYNDELLDGMRGSPANVGLDFKVTHPVVRTNPVTGWKSLFSLGRLVERGWINDVTDRESEIIKAYFLQLIAENHDLQVRFKWGQNDMAIWDNRSSFHTATTDYTGKRQGNRAVSLGEKPFFDPSSISRKEALGL